MVHFSDAFLTLRDSLPLKMLRCLPALFFVFLALVVVLPALFFVFLALVVVVLPLPALFFVFLALVVVLPFLVFHDPSDPHLDLDLIVLFGRS